MKEPRVIYKVRRNLARKSQLLVELVACKRELRRHPDRYDNLKAFCLFIGYPRSGSSLIGSLIDAHPQATIAHEANAPKLIRYHFKAEEMYEYLYRASADFTSGGRKYTGYSYAVPNQYQGTSKGKLEVIGDKFTDFAIEELTRNREIPDRIREVTGLPLRFIHPVRSPYDSITTMVLKGKGQSLQTCMEDFFALADGVLALKSREGNDAVFDHDHEAFVLETQSRLRAVCEFLRLEPLEDYIRDASSIVMARPHRTRVRIDWPDSLIKEVRQRSWDYPFFTGKCDQF